MEGPFALVDCDSFYASCERVFRPDLWNRPVAVLSNNDGCVIAASKEVKEAGIRMMSPFFEVRDDLARIGAEVFSSNYTLYGDLSRRVMMILENMAPAMEVYSIDEAFVSLYGIQDVDAFAREIRRRIHQWIGLPVTIGIGQTKTLAKVAQRLAKKDQSRGGVYQLPACETELDAILSRIPTIELWGISTAWSEKLRKAGILTARDLKYAAEPSVRKQATLCGLRTSLELRGIPSIPLEEAPPPRKSITLSRMFGCPVERLEDLEEAMSNYVARAMEKLREHTRLVPSIRVYIVTAGRPETQEHRSVSIRLAEETNTTSVVMKEALKGVRSLYRPGERYRKAGIFLEGLLDEATRQESLFPSESVQKSRRLTDMMDETNRKLGGGRLFFGSQGIKRQWSMKQEKKSPDYTTDLKGLPVARAK